MARPTWCSTSSATASNITLRTKARSTRSCSACSACRLTRTGTALTPSYRHPYDASTGANSMDRDIPVDEIGRVPNLDPSWLPVYQEYKQENESWIPDFNIWSYL